jgi:hypothetical protein
MTQFRLYGGLSEPNGTLIPHTQLDNFIENKIAPKIEAFTVLDTIGYWRGKREPGYILEFIQNDTPEFRATLKTIAAEINSTFHQEAVLETIANLNTELLETK